MSQYRNQLPQLSPKTFITDGGLETTLIFQHGYDLPEFAAFQVLKRPEGYAVLRDYYRTYARTAKTNKVGFILEGFTWRASRSWGDKLGYSRSDLAQVNRTAIALMQEVRNEMQDDQTQMVISGNLGPRGDGYRPEGKMTATEAEDYHQIQIQIFADSEADMVSAFTINYVEEAIGITRAAQKAGIPVVISFTVETDGRLPSGQLLGAAITEVDATTHHGPVYYMINCAHPTHFASVFDTDAPWTRRIRGIRANASDKSHAELDESETLDDGDPMDLAAQVAALQGHLPNLNVFGGCCGTDHRHVHEICHSVNQLN